ncbi:RNA-guided endonuclease InsQ/TnpB family protein [Parasphaerochaeta coccoides]|uniref:Transposase, IS605 OrfB family n=1 Tax=Parasphaerochaeta coccoides (strain ATCC BAA-1237 / DSM 17374 / SPN1) TaxID=760011 RepID=F4GLZ4_PARC1|nr:RNA-guided endonuclease TnpB family protein [Parasphaerochaeta coccoides]AEC03035.1 transposase, IS605 OrfB family [Parasphaerochaeta coccoides DSM 17374]
MLIAHKIGLDPTNKQATYFARASGVARFAYNWALAEWKRLYEECKRDPDKSKPSQMSLRRHLNAIKREHFPWMLEVTKNAPQMAIMHLGVAFKNFFAGRARFPQFRKKGVHDRFSISNDQFSVKDNRIRIPGLGWVRMHERVRFAGKIMSGTVSRVADRWFVSITVDTPDLSHLPKAENQGAVGVDLGVSSLATLSTGEKVEGPKAHKRLLKRLRRLSRSVSRKKHGSCNREKAKRKLSRLHARISYIRNDALHKVTTDLTTRFHTVCIEDLNVTGMMRNRHVARSVADMGFFEFRRLLEYKAHMRGGMIVVVDRFFPSSKRCSACGHTVENLPLSVREWTCPLCGARHDRDVNAAINLRDYAVSSTVSACGEEGSGCVSNHTVKPVSAKQEVGSKSV